jgi:hypothetical protein
MNPASVTAIGQRPAQQRAGGDAQRHGEQRLAHRGDGHDVEPAGLERVELQGIVGT